MDIDIDTPTSFNPLTIFDAVRASMVKDGKLRPHPCGVYFQRIAKDPITQLAAIPHEQAEQLGYFKVDFLHLNILDYFDNKHQIRTLLQKQPNWDLLLDKQIVSKLFQLHNYADILAEIRPRSVIELADTIALIRPAKQYLLAKYINTQDRQKLREELYAKPVDGGYYYKKSHAISYASNIILQLHLIQAGIL